MKARNTSDAAGNEPRPRTDERLRAGDSPLPRPAGPERPRRLRRSIGVRRMVRETRLAAADLIYPLFVEENRSEPYPIASMPGVARLSVGDAAAEAERACALGIPAVLLFGIPRTKDPGGYGSYAPNGVVQQAIAAIKDRVPDLIVITDVCLCEYTDHGHCGVLNRHKQPQPYAALPAEYVLNDETLAVLQRIAVSHAVAGADIVAPSGMIDGMIAAIRSALDEAGFADRSIMSYAVKYASAFYGPFREAADGAPQFGDRHTHQMDPANAREALREAVLDCREGADFLMVKPALAYLDVIYRLRQQYPELPLVAYNVSGEYSMVQAAGECGRLDAAAIQWEITTAIKRAGADLIISYAAPALAHSIANQD